MLVIMSNMTIDDIKEFCSEHVNGLCQQGREEIFDILRLYIADIDIDSSNSDGSRVYEKKISDECFSRMYSCMQKWLQN